MLWEGYAEGGVCCGRGLLREGYVGHMWEGYGVCGVCGTDRWGVCGRGMGYVGCVGGAWGTWGMWGMCRRGMG